MIRIASYSSKKIHLAFIPFLLNQAQRYCFKRSFLFIFYSSRLSSSQSNQSRPKSSQPLPHPSLTSSSSAPNLATNPHQEARANQKSPNSHRYATPGDDDTWAAQKLPLRLHQSENDCPARLYANATSQALSLSSQTLSSGVSLVHQDGFDVQCAHTDSKSTDTRRACT